MKKNSFILSLDQGTTSSRALLFDRELNIVAMAQQEFDQFYPQPGWVEHDPEEIWRSQRKVMANVLKQVPDGPAAVAAIGVTNQRETVVVWERRTGEAI